MKTQHKPYGLYEKYFKRSLDLLCGVAAVIFFGWLYVIIAILVRINIGSPILFTQERPGKDEKIFKLYKFRTMTDERDKTGALLPDEMRLTSFGKLLRATSLDELPEVFNIIKGDMSVVGPRPLLIKYIPLYNDFQHRRHEVKPGLTGYAQAYGRNSLIWSKKFEKDVYYVDHVSLWFDIKIVLKTVSVVLKKEGINQDGKSATMEPFKGNDSFEAEREINNG